MSIPGVKIKDKAKINGAHFYPEIVKIVNIGRVTAPKLDDDTLWITSGAERAPGRLPNSLHYENKALDFRVFNITARTKNEQKELSLRWVAKLQLGLGPDYDIVYKGNHIHIEFDPDTNPESLSG